MKYPFSVLNCSELSLTKYLFFFYLGRSPPGQYLFQTVSDEGDNCPLNTRTYTGHTIAPWPWTFLLQHSNSQRNQGMSLSCSLLSRSVSKPSHFKGFPNHTLHFQKQRDRNEGQVKKGVGGGKEISTFRSSKWKITFPSGGWAYNTKRYPIIEIREKLQWKFRR